VPVDGLTKQEQRVLATILALLLLGVTVKMYRAAHPSLVAPGEGADRVAVQLGKP
jgi:hypothetical protein